MDQSDNDNTWELEYKKLLNKKDPLDKQILKLAENGELKVNIVCIEEESEHNLEYDRKSLFHKGKHTS